MAVSSPALPRLSLFRRRSVWIPTLPGWLVLLGLAGAGCVLAARSIHPFLAPDDPAPHARVLVVEGWMGDSQLDQAVAAFQRGHYERVITTGGPIEGWSRRPGAASYADRAAGYLRTHGLGDVEVTAVPAPASAQERTFLSAVMVRIYAAQHGLVLPALDVFSAGTHGRRSRLLYRLAFGPHVEVGVLSARPDYDARHWWRTSVGTTSVIEESIGLLWTVCCFRAPPPGSHEEKWATPRRDALRRQPARARLAATRLRDEQDGGRGIAVSTVRRLSATATRASPSACRSCR